MPSKKQYNLVQNDESDVRIPLHSEEAFHRGILFNAKFIGSMEVPRPTSRMEIVAAMRRIRYEFKAKGIKKKKVSLEVSVDGLKVTLRKKKFPQLLQKKQHWYDESKLVLMHHPIYRIFYVSHDSHDLKIFSYIARDGTGNSFRCNVFKSSKKSQAMRVVRTVGQAFEVCHKLSLNGPPHPPAAAPNVGGTTEDVTAQLLREYTDSGNHHRRTTRDDDFEDIDSLQQPQPSPSSVHKDISLLGDPEESILDQPCPVTCPGSPALGGGCGGGGSDQLQINGELTALKHEIQLVRERLDQQSQQTRAAVAHARLLQDQLAAETAARVEAQARTHQLLVQNKELLEHIAALVNHLREQERLSGQSSNVLTSLLSQPTSAAAPDLGQYIPYAQAPVEAHYYFNPPAPGYPAPRAPVSNGYADELRYQTQVWESLRAGAQSRVSQPPSSSSSPFLYNAHPHSYGPGYSLPPSGRLRPPQSASAPQPFSSSLPRTRVQDQSSIRNRTRSLDRKPTEPLEPTFIKPLPFPPVNNSKNKKPPCLRNNLYEMMRPLSLNEFPPQRKSTKEVQTDPCYEEKAVGSDSPVDNKMSKLEESDSDENYLEEKQDKLTDLYVPLRRNSR